jgi:hypothetical protein
VFNGCQCGPGRPGRQDRQDVPGCQDAVGWVSEPWRRCKALNNRPPGKTACDPRLAVPNAKPSIGLVGGSGFRIELRLFAGPNGADEHTNHARTMPEPCRNHVGITSESCRNSALHRLCLFLSLPSAKQVSHFSFSRLSAVPPSHRTVVCGRYASVQHSSMHPCPSHLA